MLYCADKLIVILYQMKRLQKKAQKWFVILEMCIMKYYIRYSELPLKCNITSISEWNVWYEKIGYEIEE